MARTRPPNGEKEGADCRLTLGAVALLVVVLAGCADPILTPTEPRSQYDRYDAVRDQRAPAYFEDEYGYKVPNLRGRLLQRE